MTSKCVVIFFIFTSLSIAQEFEEIKFLSPTPNEWDFYSSTLVVSDSFLFVAESQDGFYNYGAVHVYVYDHSNQSWNLIQTLRASDLENLSLFGWSLAVSGDFLIVGAPNISVDYVLAGAAYLFHYNGTEWSETMKLTAPDQNHNDGFGAGVDIENNLIAIGAMDKENSYFDVVGAVYLFRKGADDWAFESKLTASDGGYLDRFGTEVKISCNKIFVAATEANDAPENVGAVYVFIHDSIQENWNEEAILKPTNPNANGAFGTSILLNNDFAAIGMPGNIFFTNIGTVHIFEYDNIEQVWQNTAVLSADDATLDDAFGYSIAGSNDSLLVGSISANGSSQSSGASYLFTKQRNTWTQKIKFSASDDAGNMEWFGVSGDLHARNYIIGSLPNDYTGATYYYRDISTDIDFDDDQSLPTSYQLKQNYPNPFNGSTIIPYEIPVSHHGNLSILVHDITGKIIVEQTYASLPAGLYYFPFNSNFLSSGVLFYTLKTQNITITKKMALIK